MLAGVPVLAANEGGPLETVVENRTGWLRDAGKVEQWTAIMSKVLDLSAGERGRGLLRGMGENGQERVEKEFSKEGMAERLDRSLEEVGVLKAKSVGKGWGLGWVVGALVLFAVVAGWACMEALFWALEALDAGAAGAGVPTTSVPAKVRGEL